MIIKLPYFALFTYLLMGCGVKTEEKDSQVLYLERTRVSDIVSQSFEKDSLSANMAVWDQQNIHFDTVFSGDIVSASYTVQNGGKVPLIISEVENTCGCTSTIVGQEVIQPREETTIQVKFNTEGWVGEQEKEIKVWMNTTPSIQILRLEGFVEDIN